jgi:N-acetylmuramoyl-L-alanine amidase
MSAWLLATALLAAAASGAPAAAPSGAGGAKASPSRAASRSSAFVAVVDPGHGGEKEGAVGPDGAMEKDVTLQIARRLKVRLEKLGARVLLTRNGDTTVPLANRAAFANAERADLFVSIHLNAMPSPGRSRARGVETYFLSADATDASATAVAARENADRLAGEPEPDPADPVAGILSSLEDTANLSESSRLAYEVHERIVRRAEAEDRGVKQAPFYVLAGARMPAVLVEVGFLSHPEEAAKLRSPAHQDRIAQGIADGVAAWRSAGRAAASR